MHNQTPAIWTAARIGILDHCRGNRTLTARHTDLHDPRLRRHRGQRDAHSDVSGTSLHVRRSVTTLVDCSPSVSTLQHTYSHALPRVERFQLEGDTLILTSSDGSVRLTFHVTH